MADAQLPSVLRYLRRTAGKEEAGDIRDRELLERFVVRRDGEAFAALVERHGPMVLGVCRRVLRHRHEAEDAFQATFLVLVQRAGAIKRADLLAGWLYGVAYRPALRARAGAARTPGSAAEVSDPSTTTPEGDLLRQELRQLLDEELGRLPERYRTPLVLCYLQGQTYEEAARHLGWPAGTVSGRLARAREALRARLVRRGLALSAGLLAPSLADAALRTPVPTPLLITTVQTVVLQAAAGPQLARLPPWQKECSSPCF
jgi:RNA polymerase sigma factor (sigma-70 family)